MAHQSQVHGPAKVGDDVFVGMQALVFKSEIGPGTVIEPGAKIIGVKIGEKRIVPTGAIVTKQADADALAKITDAYAFKDLNKAVVHVNTSWPTGNGRSRRNIRESEASYGARLDSLGTVLKKSKPSRSSTSSGAPTSR
jgi:carbonic anhydrase/acetyltransferase-like protein (isoleucine patch superfamily)